MGRTVFGSGGISLVDPSGNWWCKAPPGYKPGLYPGIIYTHGLGGDAQQVYSTPWQQIQALIDAGFVVIAAKNASTSHFGCQNAVDTMTELYQTLLNVGVRGTKVGLLGWSMGGLIAANWAVRNVAKVAAMQLWSPALDLAWGHNDGGYVPPYTSFAVTGPIPTAPASIDTAYTNLGTGTGSASTTATNTVTVPASGGAGVTVNLTTAYNITDPTLKGSDARPSQIIIGGVVCTYTGVVRTGTPRITGVVSTTAGTVAVTNGTVVSTNYTNNSPGLDPMKRRADFGALTVPCGILHASDDTTVPPAASDYFVAGAGGGWFMRNPKPTGGHVNEWLNGSVPVFETPAHFVGANYT